MAFWQVLYFENVLAIYDAKFRQNLHGHKDEVSDKFIMELSWLII